MADRCGNSLERLWLTTVALVGCSSNRVTFATARPDRPAERAFDIPVGNHRIGNEPFYAMIAPSTARQRRWTCPDAGRQDRRAVQLCGHLLCPLTDAAS